ncbi:hypothetical protein [Ekhidna sp.]|uniref:hypothetical protein n=1 Tax=Ekhidna sp. TaxID=2608089 RepID=UPI00329A71FF
MMWKTALSICLCFSEFTVIFGQEQINHFSQKEDTLLIRTEKVKGSAPFDFIGGFIDLEDTSDLFDFPIDHPDSLTNILGSRIPVDLESKLDYVDLISGEFANKGIVIIVDQNNNQSFRDDEIYSLLPIDWNSSKNSIPVSFSISDGRDTLQTSSWIRIGYQDRDIFYGRDEYLEAPITIDNQQFKVGIIDRVFSGNFTYGLEPELALLSSTNLLNEDIIEVRDLIKKEEYLKLNNAYYKFDSITNSGSYIRLIKERNFDEKVGTQVGMLAPDFIFKSAIGDTINTRFLHDKPLIIANTCGCGGDTQSPQASYEIMESYKNEAYVFRLDSFSEPPTNEWVINMEEEFNKDAYDKYRQAYCSRICYVIGKNRRILDKFYVTDWNTSLKAKLLFK